MKIIEKYDQHPIITIMLLTIITVLSWLFLEYEVKADSCDSQNPSIQYYTESGTTGYYTYSNYTQGTNVNSERMRLRFNNTSSTGNLYINGGVVLTATGNWTDNPTYEVQAYIGSAGIDITNSCTFQVVKDYIRNDNIVTATTWTIRWSCNYDMQTNTMSRLWIYVYHSPINKATGLTNCITSIEPSTTNETLEQQMYEYYSSLYEKSNVSEQIILNRIEEMEENIQSGLEDIEEAIEQQTQDIINAGTANQNDTNTGQTTNTEEVEENTAGIKEQIDDFLEENGEFYDYYSWQQYATTPDQEDEYGWNWIWNILTGILWTSKLQLLTMSILTLGMIKLILSR